MGFLIYGMIKLFVGMIKLSIWLVWAMIVLVVVITASLTGHERVARQWGRSLRWDIF